MQLSKPAPSDVIIRTERGARGPARDKHVPALFHQVVPGAEQQRIALNSHWYGNI